MDDLPRHAAPSNDKHILTINQVADQYQIAGHPRTIRTLQRYCNSSHLDCIKMATQLGDMYLVTPESVERHIAQIDEIEAATRVATGRDTPRSVASPVAENNEDESTNGTGPTNDDRSRPVASGDTASPRYVAQLERENSFLHEQIIVKDTQIKDLTERARETNHLIAGLQRMLSPLLGSRHDDVSPHDAPPSMTGDNT